MIPNSLLHVIALRASERKNRHLTQASDLQSCGMCEDQVIPAAL